MMMMAMVTTPAGKVRTGPYLRRRALSGVQPACFDRKREVTEPKRNTKFHQSDH